MVLSKFVACLAGSTSSLAADARLPAALVGAEKPLFQSIWILWSMLLVSGLGAILLGLFLLLPRLGTFARLISVILVLTGGLAAAGIGGWNHYTLRHGTSR